MKELALLGFFLPATVVAGKQTKELLSSASLSDIALSSIDSNNKAVIVPPKSTSLRRELAKEEWECLDAYWDLWQNETLISEADLTNFEVSSRGTFEVCDTSDRSLFQCNFPFDMNDNFTNVCEENNGMVQYHSFNSSCSYVGDSGPGRILLVFEGIPDCIPAEDCSEEMFEAQFEQTAGQFALIFEQRFRAEGLDKVRCRAETDGSADWGRHLGFLFAVASAITFWLVVL